MKAIMAINPQDSFSFSRRYFPWKKKSQDEEYDDEEVLTNYNSSSSHLQEPEEIINPEEINLETNSLQVVIKQSKKKMLPILAVSSKFMRFAFTFGKNRPSSKFSGLGMKVIGTLFGYRRGHVHLAFQEDPKLSPAFLVELATPTSILVKEMASGLVRIALECEKKGGSKLLDEPVWRTYCNGRKCGFAMKRECGNKEWKVLNSIGPITMGAGVLPGNGENGVGSEGELMYMRAKFERVVGSKDSEAFYMMNPDAHGGPELSIYLLRV